jgi:predicted amidohydrolase
MLNAAAQSTSIAGDIDENVRRHAAFVRKAGEHHANVVVFPELSLTGYEPTIAKEAAIDAQAYGAGECLVVAEATPDGRRGYFKHVSPLREQF